MARQPLGCEAKSTAEGHIGYLINRVTMLFRYCMVKLQFYKPSRTTLPHRCFLFHHFLNISNMFFQLFVVKVVL